MGVTLKLNRNDGTLKIKGKKHMDWFKDNFEQVSSVFFSIISRVSQSKKLYKTSLHLYKKTVEIFRLFILPNEAVINLRQSSGICR